MGFSKCSRNACYCRYEKNLALVDRFLLLGEGMGSADSARLGLCVTRQCVDGWERCREDMCERRRGGMVEGPTRA